MLLRLDITRLVSSWNYFHGFSQLFYKAPETKAMPFFYFFFFQGTTYLQSKPINRRYRRLGSARGWALASTSTRSPVGMKQPAAVALVDSGVVGDAAPSDDGSAPAAAAGPSPDTVSIGKAKLTSGERPGAGSSSTATALPPGPSARSLIHSVSKGSFCVSTVHSPSRSVAR